MDLTQHTIAQNTVSSVQTERKRDLITNVFRLSSPLMSVPQIQGALSTSVLEVEAEKSPLWERYCNPLQNKNKCVEELFGGKSFRNYPVSAVLHEDHREINKI